VFSLATLIDATERQLMPALVNWLDHVFYPGVSSNWDDGLLRQAVLGKIDQHTHLLDLGAGAGIIPQNNFKNLTSRVCGIDPDPRVLSNPYLHEAKVAFGSHIPYSDDEFDIVFSDNVLEHLEKPIEVFHEVYRVLKPGGYFVVKTPNRSHYVPLIARLTPLSFHRLYNRARGRRPQNTFHTFYRANSCKQIAELATSSSLQIESIQCVESRPEYLRLSALTYLFGIAYERTVNLSPLLAHWRVVLVAVLRKPKT
jgi:ubiquinone/menaquinone biosynthesis C-methylase UbiE